MKNKILLLSGAAILLLASCDSGTGKKTPREIFKSAARSASFKVQGKKYTMDMPEGWRTTDTVMEGINIRFLFAPATAAHANINIIEESMSGVSFDDYIKGSNENLKAMANVEIKDTRTVQIAGRKADKIYYTQAVNGMKLGQVCYAVPDNGIAYVITATATYDSLDAYRATFDDIVGSFKFAE